MFGLPHPGAVIGTQANVLAPVNSVVWRAKKGQFEVVTERTWPNHEWSKRGRHTREYVWNELWQIVVGDRPVRKEVIHTQTNAQSKKVFSYAMTVMDKIDGWEEGEEKMVGSRIAACTWIHTKAVLCEGQESTQKYLRRRLQPTLESVNWVCEEAMEGHGWVSENHHFHAGTRKFGGTES